MFHVMLLLIPIGLLVIFVSILLFGITTVIAGLIGGTTAALLVKEHNCKRLLFIGFCILSFIGLLCLIPFIIAFAGLPATFFSISSVFIYICIALLTIIGIRLAKALKNKVAKTALIILFCAVLIIALSLSVFTLIATNVLLST